MWLLETLRAEIGATLKKKGKIGLLEESLQ